MTSTSQNRKQSIQRSNRIISLEINQELYSERANRQIFVICVGKALICTSPTFILSPQRRPNNSILLCRVVCLTKFKRRAGISVQKNQPNNTAPRRCLSFLLNRMQARCVESHTKPNQAVAARKHFFALIASISSFRSSVSR